MNVIGDTEERVSLSRLAAIAKSALATVLFTLLTDIFRRVSSLSVASKAIFNMPITKIFARQIFDSRGNPTVEVDVTTELGMSFYVLAS